MANRNNELEYRGWRFFESKRLIPREVEWKNYFDQKFADIDIDAQELREVMDEALEEDLEPKFAAVNEHIDEVHEHIEQDITEAKDEVENNITEAKDEIIEKIEAVDVEPIVTAAKIEIEEKIEEAKDHLCCDICCAKNDIIEHIDEKLSDLNQQVLDEDGD